MLVHRPPTLLQNIAVTLGATLLIVSSGCSNKLPDVTGVVTLDGEPLPTNEATLTTVTFSPQFDGGSIATGFTDENGQYRLSSGTKRGVVPGEYAVAVQGKKVSPPPDEASLPITRPFTPNKYANTTTSGFSVQVVQGKNQLDFALVSKP